MLSKVVLLAAIATAQAKGQSYYEWAGSTSNFDEPSLWTGPNPLNGDVPSMTTVGAIGVTTVTMLPKSNTFSVGKKLMLYGTTKLFLGDGSAGSKTTLSFAAGAKNAKPTAFALDFKKTDSNATYFDYGCHLNWKVANYKDNKKSIPKTPPCSQDDVLFKNNKGNSYSVNIYDGKFGADKIVYGTNPSTDTTYLRSCNDVDDQSGPLYINFNGEFKGCKKSFNFAADNDKFNKLESCKTTCPGTVVTLPDGSTLEVQTGDRGTATKTDKDGKTTTVKGVTVGSDGTVNIPAKGDNPAVNVNSKGVIVTLNPTASPTSNVADASLAAAGGMTTIVGAAVGGLIVIIIIAVVVIVMVRKSADSGSVADRNIVSFENPMYDDVQQSGGGGGFDDNNDGGIYDDPEMSNNTGYMDVPVGSDRGNGGTGYMDVAPDGGTGGTGYMDVAPNGNSDDSDDSDDNEDI